MITPIIFILILGLLVLSHEFGHFVLAKRAGMRVDEFAFGFPPRLFSWQRGETKYSINLIPFGGFVKIHGEDSLVDDVAESQRDRNRHFTARPKSWQAAVIVAGVVFNLILAWVLLSLGLSFGFPAALTDENRDRLENIRVVIAEVASGSPAEVAGLRAGDMISTLEMKGQVYDINGDPEKVGHIVRGSGGSAVAISYTRGSASFSKEITPMEKEGKYVLGVSVDALGTLKLPIWEALFEGGKKTIMFFWMTLAGFFGLISDAIRGQASLESVSGPVGIYFLVSDAASFGLSYLLGFTAIISISLAVINILPFPALDGGRLALLLVEALRGKPIPEKLVYRINMIGFFVLIALVVFISYHDLSRYDLFN